jgi:CHAT domain-containing protein
VLLVVNPTLDLDGAEAEGERVRGVISGITDTRLTVVHGAEATRPNLIDLLKSGRFDALHYAGHAFFDPRARHRSGILCAGGEVLSGVDMAELSSLPALVVCNACESARVRGQATIRTHSPGGGIEHTVRKAPSGVREEIARNVSFAEAFLRGGIANYVGTHWPVGDTPAVEFATALYTGLARGETMNEAIRAGRQAVEANNSKDWADYIHYGDPNFALKIPQRTDGGGVAIG